MSRIPSFFCGLFLIAFISLGLGLAHAQFRASLCGTVTDLQGAVVPGATVTLTNTATNQKLVATSDDNGIYQFSALGPAPYALTAEHVGFKKKALDYVQIIPEQLNSLDLQLESGEVQQTFTVSWHDADARLIAGSFSWHNLREDHSGMRAGGLERPLLNSVSQVRQDCFASGYS